MSFSYVEPTSLVSTLFNNKFAKNVAPVCSIDIYKKTCFSTGKIKYFVETFRALGVARGHSSYKLTKSVSFYSSVRKSTGKSN